MNLFGFNLITGLIGQRLFALFRREDDRAPFERRAFIISKSLIRAGDIAAAIKAAKSDLAGDPVFLAVE